MPPPAQGTGSYEAVESAVARITYPVRFFAGGDALCPHGPELVAQTERQDVVGGTPATH